MLLITSQCPECGPVPVVSTKLAEMILAGVPVGIRDRILTVTFDWLTTKHAGIRIYKGITGRAYTNEEKDAIGPDQGLVSELECPYRGRLGCVIGGLGPHYNVIEEHSRGAPYGFLPALVARAWDPKRYKGLIEAQEIADAKVALLTRNSAFYSYSDVKRLIEA